MNFKFPVVKLTDYEKDISDLENLKNPFAIATAVHLHYKRGQRKKSAAKTADSFYQELLECKFSVVRALFKAGFNQKEVRGFLDFIDIILQLPPAYELKFIEHINTLEKEEKVTFTEKLIEDGAVLGEVKGILKMAEKGHMPFKVAKAELEAFRSQIQDKNFWAEIDKKLENS
jgi:predicted nucleic acid-binding protein